MSDPKPQPESGEAVRSTDLLGIAEQAAILSMARNRMRDLECEYRKKADNWHNAGAMCEARRCCDIADAIDEAITELRTVELQYLRAKHATYA